MVIYWRFVGQPLSHNVNRIWDRSWWAGRSLQTPTIPRSTVFAHSYYSRWRSGNVENIQGRYGNLRYQNSSDPRETNAAVTMAKIVKTPLSIASHVGLGELALSWLQYCVANITFATPALFCNEGILFQRQQHLSVPQIKTPTTSIDWVQYVADFQSCQQ